MPWRAIGVDNDVPPTQSFRLEEDDWEILETSLEGSHGNEPILSPYWPMAWADKWGNSGEWELDAARWPQVPPGVSFAA